MNPLRKLTLQAGLCLGVLAGGAASGATAIIGDTSTVTGTGSGFALNTGINSGINPPTTRLTGSTVSGIRYINTGLKATTAYTITSSKVRVAAAVNAGRFTFSSDGTTPFDFGPAVGAGAASPSNPVVYDISLSVDNDSPGIHRCSFAIGTAEGDATTWDFGFQVYRAASGNTFYTIGKRIDTAASGLAADLNAAIHTMAAGTAGTEITVLMRVTDAGSQSSAFNSRVQLSLNGGSTWIYDTASDANLTSGFRFNGAGRYIMWDVAPDAGPVTYDNLAMNWNSGPRTWTGAGANGNWNTAANWGGVVPASGDKLIFAGTTRQINTNNISALSVPWAAFNNGGFEIYGNVWTVNSAVTNAAGNNTIKSGLAWGTTAAKTWSLANGTEFVLDSTTTVEVDGDHTLTGAGTIRQKAPMNIGQATTAAPAFILNQGKHIVDATTFNSRGGYRIGSLATGSGAQTIVSNGATMSFTAATANLRVGDSANPTASQLVVDNSTLSMAGGSLAVPFAAGAIGSVTQNGGIVSGATIKFSEAGAGNGTYAVKDGVLQPVQIVETTAAGTSTITFDNATLRAVSGANSAFMTGLNSAQILAGGLTVEASADVVIGQALSGAGALDKTGANKVTLSGANTYSGATTISAGTLAVGAGGAIASPTITIVNGTTFDVSAAGYSVPSTQTIARNATSGSGAVNGTITLNSGAKVSLQASGSAGTVGTIAVAGGLTLNGNTITIDVAGAALNAGTYPLITYTGTKTGSFNATPTFTGQGVATGLVGKIVESAGQIALNVFIPPTPPHGVAAANIKVVQNDLANTADSVTVTTTMSINGFTIRDASNRGDYNVQIGASANDEINTGVLMTSVSQNGRDNQEDSGTNYCTAAMAYSRSGANGGSFFIPVSTAPDGAEYNINVSAAFFPFTNWIAGHARNSADVNGGANDLFTGSAGLTLGTHFVDNGGGISTVNLLSMGINSTTDGVLIVNHARNEGNRATSVANPNGTWTIHVRDNATNGAATEQDPVAFVYVPKSNVSVISGKFQGDGTILMYNGTTPKFSVTNSATGTWALTIPGQTPSTGVLIVSPEGGDSVNQDNTISFQPSGSTWIIQSRDVPGMGLQTPSGPVASFVFIPAPTATLVSPANNAANVASSPTLKVAVVNPAGGNVKVTFTGRYAGKPYPGKDFLIAVLPDTQNYAREESGIGQATKEMWFAQTDWICNNRISENIAYVATLGDCVQNADTLFQWRNATNAMYRLEKQSTTKLVDGVPYGITVGNHDQDPIGNEDGDTTFYNQFFGTPHFQNKAYYGGHFASDNDNWYDLFSAGDLDFLVISFEYGRYGAAVLDWAESVIAAYPSRRIIVLTHHAGDDNADVNATTTAHSAQGAAIYERLKTKPNFFLMMGGHVFNEGGEGRRTDTFNGNTVRTLVSDYQNRMNGGNGLMRLMNFSPSNNLVSVKTYSPFTGNYESDANSQFTFNYNMQPSGAGAAPGAYVNIGTNLNVAPGAQTSVLWSGLQASKTYEWSVTVTDAAGDYSTSTEWKFTTTAGFAPLMAGDTDSNENSVSDNWETKYAVTNIEADSDGDGQSNRAEYLAKTNPKDANSVLKILSAERQADGNVKVTWSSAQGVRYRIQYADGDLTSFTDLPDVIQEMNAAPAGETSKQSFTDNSGGNPTNNVRFYRVKVVTD